MSNTRERIINTAIDLFADKGFSETSMRDIATGAYITPASIYNHFSSKAGLLGSILREYIDYISESTVSIDDVDRVLDTTDTRAILDRMCFHYASDNAERYSKILKIILHEQFKEPTAMHFVRDNMFAYNQTYIKWLLDKLVEAGRIKPVRTDIYAKIFVSLSVSECTEMMFYEFSEFAGADRITKMDATYFLLDQLLE